MIESEADIARDLGANYLAFPDVFLDHGGRFVARVALDLVQVKAMNGGRRGEA